MQHYRSNKYIVVESDDGKEPIYIDPTSPFYNYVQIMIDAEGRLQKILKEFRDKGQFHEINNFMNIISDLEKLVKLSEDAILRRANEFTSYSFEKTASFEDNSIFEQAKIRDNYLFNQIGLLEEFLTNENPIIAFAKIDDVTSEFKAIELIEKDYFVENHETADVIKNKASTPALEESLFPSIEIGLPIERGKRIVRTVNESLDNEMMKLGVNPDSAFYEYIKERLRFKFNIESTLNLLDAKRGREIFTDTDNELVQKLLYIADRNNEILDIRYSHYNTLRNARSNRPIERILDQKGKNYLERIASLDFQTNSQCQKTYKDIYYGISNRELIGRVDEMYDGIARIKKFDEELRDKSLGIENFQLDENRRWKPKGKTARQIKKEHNIRENKNNRGQVIATIALSASLLIAGISIATTLNKPSKESIPIEYKVEEPEISKNETMQSEKSAKESIEEYVNSNPLKDGQTWVIEEGSNGTWSARVELPPDANLGEMGKTLKNLDSERISVVANAISKGNNHVPPSVYEVYSIGEVEKKNIDQEFVASAFEDMDEKIRRVKFGVDSHQLSFQMSQIAEDLIKYEIAEALNLSGKYSGITTENIEFYVKFKNNDEVSAYDILLLNDNGKNAVTIARMDHIKGSILDSAIKSSQELDRASDKVSVFEESEFIAGRTNNLYSFVSDLLKGELDITLDSKGRPVVSEKNGEISKLNEQER